MADTGDLVNLHVSYNFNAIPEMSEELEGKLALLINKACFDLEALAKTKVPVRTGRLKNSIRVSKTATAGDLQGQVGAFADYAIYVHFGTVRMAARPFMVVDWIKEPLISAIQSMLRQYGRLA